MMLGNSVNAAMYREQVQVLGENLHDNISKLMKNLGIPDPEFKALFESTTGLNYNRNVLGYKVNELTKSDVAALQKLKTQSVKMAQAAKGAGRLGIALDGVANVEDIKETCEKYGDDSMLCHKAVVGDSAGFVAGEYGGEAAGSIAGTMVGCDAVFGIETLGAGIVACTIIIGSAAIVGGAGSAFAIKHLSNKIYDNAGRVSQSIKIFNNKYSLSQ
jgi:hypothetical protein